jgi:hypothetical protein
VHKYKVKGKEIGMSIINIIEFNRNKHPFNSFQFDDGDMTTNDGGGCLD